MPRTRQLRPSCGRRTQEAVRTDRPDQTHSFGSFTEFNVGLAVDSQQSAVPCATFQVREVVYVFPASRTQGIRRGKAAPRNCRILGTNHLFATTANSPHSTANLQFPVTTLSPVSRCLNHGFESIAAASRSETEDDCVTSANTMVVPQQGHHHQLQYLGTMRWSVGGWFCDKMWARGWSWLPGCWGRSRSLNFENGGARLNLEFYIPPHSRA